MAKSKTPPRKRSNEQDLSRCLEFFQRLDFGKVDAALEKARALAADPWVSIDSVYRILHHSFKMYPRFHDATYRYITYMLEPFYHHAHFVHKTKECDPENVAFDQIIYELDYWYVDPILLSFIKTTKDVKFTLDRNEEKLWSADARNLTAAYFMAQSVCISTLEALQRMGKKEGFLYAEKPVALEHHDALFLETWEGLGSVLRYAAWRHEDSDVENEIKAILLTKK
jgi:hypothetical protein